MAKRGDKFSVKLSKSHLNWGTYRKTETREKIYGEGYIPIPAHISRSLKLLNNNGTNGEDILGQNIFFCTSADGLFSGELRSQGCSKKGSPYAKQFSGNKNLKALGNWYSQINAQIGTVIEVEFISKTTIVIRKL